MPPSILVKYYLIIGNGDGFSVKVILGEDSLFLSINHSSLASRTIQFNCTLIISMRAVDTRWISMLQMITFLIGLILCLWADKVLLCISIVATFDLLFEIVLMTYDQFFSLKK